MEVRFREIDPFNCWIWLRFPHPPGQGERAYVETVFDSWFFLGKLGGFNAENLQAHDADGGEIGWMAYDAEAAAAAQPALMHSMGAVEYEGAWARCWLDLGLSDALAIDVLINTVGQLSRDVVEIEELVIGGVNDDWPIEEQPQDLLPFTGT
ncbi:MAG: DUF3531 family protein [Cyanobacteria bacterium J06638_7]